MRKLAESTLVMLDDVTQAPERRASFDAESTAYSAEQPKLRRVRHGPGHLQKFTGKPDRGNKPDHADSDPRPAAATFVTTEHFTLQGARSSTISESTGRASVFLQAVSGGLIALGLVATAAKTGAAFYMFGLILLPTLAFVGLATFHRVLQSGIEDLDMRAASRSSAAITSITHPRWPARPARHRRTAARPGTGDRPVAAIRDRRRDDRRITAVLAGSAGGLLAAVVSGHSLVAALIAGMVVAVAALTGLMRYQNSAWIRGTTASLSPADKQAHTEPHAASNS